MLPPKAGTLARNGDSMIDLILNDSKLRPDLFFWRGSIPISEVEEWKHEHAITAPQDLEQLWHLNGGGDLLESETMLQPITCTEDNLILPRSKWLWGTGLNSDYYVFHEGLHVSVFRNSDHSFRSLNSTDFSKSAYFKPWTNGICVPCERNMATGMACRASESYTRLLRSGGEGRGPSTA